MLQRYIKFCGRYLYDLAVRAFMGNRVVVGTQWGDEGKGKIVDVLAEEADIVVRYQGGDNAGHTVVVDGRKYKFHLIPSGTLHGKIGVLGNGMVINLETLLKEKEIVSSPLFISNRAHVILPCHVEQDTCVEASPHKIGSTKKGIAYAYRDKYARQGVLMGDLLYPSLLEEKICRLMGEEGKTIAYQYHATGKMLAPHIIDTHAYLMQALQEKKSLLFEGAQGAMLAVDHGDYPHITSSNPTAGALCDGAGVPLSCINDVVGVVKAYTTKVGDGFFPTELHGSLAETLRERGHEYGTTTGRPRRCGWLDLNVVRYACELSGVTALALTKLDILDSFETIHVCTHYILRGQCITSVPHYPGDFHAAEPVYQELSGWQTSTVGARSWDALPLRAQQYCTFLEQAIGIPVRYISTGEERSHLIFRQ